MVEPNEDENVKEEEFIESPENSEEKLNDEEVARLRAEKRRVAIRTFLLSTLTALKIAALLIYVLNSFVFVFNSLGSISTTRLTRPFALFKGIPCTFNYVKSVQYTNATTLPADTQGNAQKIGLIKENVLLYMDPLLEGNQNCPWKGCYLNHALGKFQTRSGGDCLNDLMNTTFVIRCYRYRSVSLTGECSKHTEYYPNFKQYRSNFEEDFYYESDNEIVGYSTKNCEFKSPKVIDFYEFGIGFVNETLYSAQIVADFMKDFHDECLVIGPNVESGFGTSLRTSFVLLGLWAGTTAWLLLTQAIKIFILIFSFCIKFFRKPGVFIHTVDSPLLLILLLFSSYYRSLLLYVVRTVTPLRRTLIYAVTENIFIICLYAVETMLDRFHGQIELIVLSLSCAVLALNFIEWIMFNLITIDYDQKDFEESFVQEIKQRIEEELDEKNTKKKKIFSIF